MSGSSNPVPPWMARFCARFPGFAERYLSLDPRSVGLGRIYLGVLLLVDLIRRVPDMSVWYTNSGLLPNHTLLWRPGARYQFSFFFAASHLWEVALLFAFCGVVFFCFLIGWKTRLFHWLSAACLVSLHDRVIFLENGGDVVLSILIIWTLFLPMGVRFSVDSLLSRLRGRREGTLAELEDRTALQPELRPAVTLGVLALLLQVSVIYYFNVVHKGGQTWADGTAVHYALQTDRFITWLGWKLRPHLSPPISATLTYTALVLESLGPLLLLNPYRWRTTRALAMVVMPGLHIGFALLMNLGLFSFNMIAFFVLLIPDASWNFRFRRARPPGLTVEVDDTSPLCFQLARILARLDPTHIIRLVPAMAPASGATTQLAAVNLATGKRFEGLAAIVQICAALPALFPLAILLKIPGLSALLAGLYRLFEARRAGVGAGLGLPALGLPALGLPSSGPQIPAASPPPVRQWLSLQALRLRELAVVVLMIALGSQVLMENKAVPRWLKPGQAEWMRAIVEYPRLFQGWSMFAPNAPQEDNYVAVEAVTVDGRAVDPLNERGSRTAPVPANYIPEFLNQDEFFCDYMQRIAGEGAYHPPLSEWIRNYHHRTGRDGDRIVRFEVYNLTDRSPPIGQTQPTDLKKTKLFSWP